MLWIGQCGFFILNFKMDYAPVRLQTYSRRGIRILNYALSQCHIPSIGLKP